MSSSSGYPETQYVEKIVLELMALSLHAKCRDYSMRYNKTKKRSQHHCEWEIWWLRLG